MGKYKLPGGEFSHVCRNHEEVRLKADSDGCVDVADEELDEVLRQLAADPDHPIELVKVK